MLASGEHRAALTEALGPDGERELAALAARVAAAPAPRGPRAYVLPGLMGSRLGARGADVDHVLWLDLPEVAAGHLTRLALPGGRYVIALGAMLLNSLKLKLRLQLAGFDARFHAYDWRLPLAELSAGLNARLAADRARGVMLVGHSMGGLVARAALAADRGRIARVVQLGSPNSGSYAPVLALRGVYPTVRKLAAIDRRHSAEDLARLVFRTLPSLHELLPRAAGPADMDLFDAAHWPDDELRPDAARLAAARGVLAALPDADARCLQIVGVAQDTVLALRRSGHGFEFEIGADGDGTVPRELARWRGASTWYVAEKHGALPNNDTVVAAVIDLLRSGRTRRLPSHLRRRDEPPRRWIGEASLRRVAAHKVDWRSLSAEARRRLLEPVVSPEFHAPPAGLAESLAHKATPGEPRLLELRLVHGSIADANAAALAVGVLGNVDPSGAAAAIDLRLGGRIRALAQRRAFSARPGRVVRLPIAGPGLAAEFVLLAGLGNFDSFGLRSVRRAARAVVRSAAQIGAEDLAIVLFGAGSGLAPEPALEHQLRGLLEGLRSDDPGRRLRRITICETQARKYAALRRVLPGLAGRLDSDALLLQLDLGEPKQALRRTRSDSTATARDDSAYLLVTCTDPDSTALQLRVSLLTAGAKAAVLSGSTSLRRRELEALLAPLERGELTARRMPAFGARLAEMLLPAPVRAGLAACRRRPLAVVHDREASRVPWEALALDGEFPALGAGLSRRYAGDGLSVARWQAARSEVEPLRLLVTADPTEDLPGARLELEALRELFVAPRTDTAWLVGSAATRRALLAALRPGDRLGLHFAGHAYFDAARPQRSGLVCADGEILRGTDLAAIENLPALVFFNACEAGRVRRRAGAGTRVAAGDGAGLAEAVLAGGVANYLGTHWPVGDSAALIFSTQLYRELLRGASLGPAIVAARRALQARGSLDWANYLHYGSPEFRLVTR